MQCNCTRASNKHHQVEANARTPLHCHCALGQSVAMVGRKVFWFSFVTADAPFLSVSTRKENTHKTINHVDDSSMHKIDRIAFKLFTIRLHWFKHDNRGTKMLSFFQFIRFFAITPAFLSLHANKPPRKGYNMCTHMSVALAAFLHEFYWRYSHFCVDLCNPGFLLSFQLSHQLHIINMCSIMLNVPHINESALF